MKKKPEPVSVVIVFKGIEHLQQLKQCFASLINQTVLPTEVIIVSEQNTDSLNSVIPEGLKMKINRIMVKADKNNARNLGIKSAKGIYIIYLDHDMVADELLVEKCLEAAKTYDAVIIPEKGSGSSFWLRCRKLEKELLTFDSLSVSPRFYRKDIIPVSEKPFNTEFGLLDEWGFKYKIQQNKKVRIGYCHSFVTIIETNFSLQKHLYYRFKMGQSMKYFYELDKTIAWQRIDPWQRGVFFYGRRINYLFKEPLYFSGLVVLKSLEMVAFISGFLLNRYFKN